jgi:hypothetical protein
MPIGTTLSSIFTVGWNTLLYSSMCVLSYLGTHDPLKMEICTQACYTNVVTHGAQKKET